MIHLKKLINNIFFDICGRAPTYNELEEYSHALLFKPNTHVWQDIFERHIRAQSKRFLVFDQTDAQEDDIDLTNKTLLVVGLVRNIANNIKYIKTLIEDLRKSFKKVVFYFYHNNSSDNSIDLLKSWMAQDKDVAGTFASDNVITVIDIPNKTIGNRIPMFARMRNQNVKDALAYFGCDFDFVLMTNTDFVGHVDSAGICKSLQLKNEWNIICGNCCFAKSYYHYDAYALRLLDESDNIRDIYSDFDKYYGINTLWLDRFYVFDAWTRVKSGFGDMCIIRMNGLMHAIDTCQGEICQVDETSPHICELISMCKRIGGPVWVSPYINYPATMSLEGVSYGNPICFVPRDAGFFSVFNFFVGMLLTGTRAYPCYKKQLFNALNNENKHFCYWSKHYDNAWFEYFEPVRYYHGDTEHDSNHIEKYRLSYGESAGGEFRLPLIYGKLMQDQTLFSSWRKGVNGVLRKYVKVKQNIIDEADKFWNDTIKPEQNVIGVHFRHPSHFVESGYIKVKDYFNAIDKLLLDHPQSKIFLATDTELGMMAFSFKYGDRVHWIPEIKRVDIDNILDWAHATRSGKADNMDFINGQGYQLHYTSCGLSDGTKLGKDVLKEVLCLSKCTWFVHCLSNVALAVSYFNPDVEMIMLPEKKPII